ncbi:MAG: META domain-containing protein [Cytophagales bacterium]|nr:MAG: META domain-containing protein [Cytophagales bacterium]
MNLKPLLIILTLSAFVPACQPTKNVLSASEAADQKPNTNLVETYWKLIELNGKPIGPSGNGQREAHLILKTADTRVQGNSGCNSFGGTYQLPGANQVSLSRMAATKMACMNGMETEDALFTAFEQVSTYAIRRDTLLLNSPQTAPLARFVAVTLR